MTSPTILQKLGRFISDIEFDLGSEPFSLGKASLIAQLGLIENASLLVDQATINMVRYALIDTLGCILIGSKQPASIQTRSAVSNWGKGTAAVFGTNLALPAPWAALANGTAGHCLDFDDWESPGNTHISVVLFAALLAASAENQNEPVSGRAIFDAYLVGFEIIARIGEGVNFDHYENGWHSTATLGAVGAAAAVARLKRLTAEQATHSMSIAFSHAVGYTDQFGSNAKALQVGSAAKTGVIAATFAANGLTGHRDILESGKGFARLMGKGNADLYPAIMEKLGSKLAATEFGLAVKPYPSCGYTHRVIDCALKLRERADFEADQIKKITVSITDFHLGILPFQQPKNQAEAMFSAPFCVAQALLNGQLTAADLAANIWQDPTVSELTAKVIKVARPRKNPELNYDPADPDWVEIEYNSGEKQRAEVAFPLGTPENPMSAEQILAKFFNNSGLHKNDAEVYTLQNWIEAADIVEVVNHFYNQPPL